MNLFNKKNLSKKCLTILEHGVHDMRMSELAIIKKLGGTKALTERLEPYGGSYHAVRMWNKRGVARDFIPVLLGFAKADGIKVDPADFGEARKEWTRLLMKL